ncbi:MAG: PqqD family protein [Deltaproteobacteria bacterium]|nr:PqqD family protein [Deltaproteobacteria bacterium]
MHRVVGDEVFILMADSRMHWLRNATARTLWEGLVAAGGEGTTARALAQGLSLAYAVEPAAALADVLDFLRELAERGLIEARDDSDYRKPAKGPN